MGRNRDAALKEAEEQASADHARDKELRDLLSKNPGRWPRLEAGGIRVQDWKRVGERPMVREIAGPAPGVVLVEARAAAGEVEMGGGVLRLNQTQRLRSQDPRIRDEADRQLLDALEAESA